MISSIADKLDEIRRLCARHRVKALWFFGSATREDVDPSPGDLDAIVVFDDMDYRERAERYYALRDEMAALLGMSVDLIEDEAITNPYFRAEVDRSRVLVHAA